MFGSSNKAKQEELDRQAREEALQRRLDVEHAVESAKRGEMPSTGQITSKIDEIQQSGAIHEIAKDMTPLGKKVAADAEKLMESTKKMLEEKNEGDNLQKVLFYGTKGMNEAARSAQSKVSTEPLHKGAQDAQALAAEAGDKAMRIARMMITSPQFRRLIFDLQQIVQEAIQMSVSEQHEGGSKPAGKGAKGASGEMSPEEALRETADTARGAADKVGKKGANAAQAQFQKYSEGKQSATEAAQNLGQQAADAAKRGVEGLHVPEEQQRRLIERFKQLMLSVQKTSEYQSTLDDLVEIIRQLGNRGAQMREQLKSAAERAGRREGESLQKATESAKELMERFASNKSLDPLIEACQVLAEKAAEDKKLHRFLNDAAAYLNHAARDTKYLQSDKLQREGEDLFDRSQRLFSKNYREQIEKIVAEARDFTDALTHDKTTSEWRADFETLIKDVLLDADGKPTLKYGLLKDFAQVLYILGEKLEWLPLPRIEGENDDYHYIFDNVVLRCSSMIPRHMAVDTHTSLALPTLQRNLETNQLERKGEVRLLSHAHIKIENLNLEAKDIAFYYAKKSGFPKMTDVGYVDIIIPGDGLTLDLTLTPASETDPESTFRVVRADVTLHDLKLRMHDTKNDFFYTILRPIVQATVRSHLERTLMDGLTSVMKKLDEQMTKIKEQARSIVPSGKQALDAVMSGNQDRLHAHEE
ncbi:uncharacterized protein VTP21DRAFT_2141 [Calcarisporiella thermophila]|uniref:uncharacterized protein n=1 Tax=Calcarisporiella thermophila TaxID=911321 RepID=UPI003743B7A6